MQKAAVPEDRQQQDAWQDCRGAAAPDSSLHAVAAAFDLVNIVRHERIDARDAAERVLFDALDKLRDAPIGWSFADTRAALTASATDRALARLFAALEDTEPAERLQSVRAAVQALRTR